MLDKKGIEIKTGDIVKIENAFFKNDNGYYFVDNAPGDISWCGSDYSLHKIGKRGKISTAKRNIAFWPLSHFCNDRMKNAEASEHDKENATIEVIYNIDNSEVIAHFEENAANHEELAKEYSYRFGEESETTETEKKIVEHYHAVVERMKKPEEPKEEPQEQEKEEPQKEEPKETQTFQKYYDIDEKTARTAHYMMSFREYKENSATDEYRQSVDNAVKLAEKKKKEVSPYYHDKIDDLLDRYAKKLAEWINAYNRNGASCPSVMVCGSANFPTKKKEKQINRENTLWQEYDKIKGILQKIKSIGTGAIDFADPHAKELLQDRLESLQNQLEKGKALNAYYRKHNTFKGFSDYTDEKAEKLEKDFDDLKERCAWVKKPFPDYELSSLRDKIKRTKERIEQLENLKNTSAEPEKFDGGEIIRNKEINRLQIVFDNKPDEETRQALKSASFRWSPKNKAWQRQLTQNAERALKSVLKLA